MPVINPLSPDRVFVIAEVGQNHDGSLGQAHAFIDSVSRTGADAVKFQTHIAAAESTPGEPFRVKFSYEDATRYDYWKRMEFTLDQWSELKRHAEDRGLIFMSSAFSVEAVELLKSVGVVAWKIGSGEISSRGMLRAMAETALPMFVSTGMSSYGEIAEVVADLRAWNAPFALLQCCSRYPSSVADVGVNVISELRTRFDCPVGYSDHSGTIWPSLAAVAAGATAVEAHITMSREMFGPDVASSLVTQDFCQMVEGIRTFSAIRHAPVDKDATWEELAEMRRLFGKGAIAVRQIEAGSTLTKDMVSFKKPAHGVRERDLDSYYGRAIRRSIAPGEFITADDFVA